MVNFYFIKGLMAMSNDEKKVIILNNYSKRVLKELMNTPDQKKRDRIVEKYEDNYADLYCSFGLYELVSVDKYFFKICTYHSTHYLVEPTDYFRYFKIDRKEGNGYSLEVIDAINSDLEKYREHMIKKYMFDEKRGTDMFCYDKFLHDYDVAINVFGLHSDLNCKKSFNRFINYCYNFMN